VLPDRVTAAQRGRATRPAPFAVGPSHRFEPVLTGYPTTMTNTATNTATEPAPKSTIAGLSDEQSVSIISILQERLAALLDLQLTLKHIHWNVVGVNFISVHEFLDPQVDAVRKMSDAVAERIATLGGEPLGTPGAIMRFRTWDDYALNREPTVRHLSALDAVYTGVVGDHRTAMTQLGELDPVTQDLIIGHVAELEQFQWFVRAHLQDSSGDVTFRNTGT
jgi:starvation-inducible DNA-binding protein